MWLTFYTLYNNFVPISLYVTIEMVNYIQAMFIDKDLEVRSHAAIVPDSAVAHASNMKCDMTMIAVMIITMTMTTTTNDDDDNDDDDDDDDVPPVMQMYDPDSDTPAVARTSNMNGDMTMMTHNGDDDDEDADDDDNEMISRHADVRPRLGHASGGSHLEHERRPGVHRVCLLGQDRHPHPQRDGLQALLGRWECVRTRGPHRHRAGGRE
jgi:hypothetical protein